MARSPPRGIAGEMFRYVSRVQRRGLGRCRFESHLPTNDLPSDGNGWACLRQSVMGKERGPGTTWTPALRGLVGEEDQVSFTLPWDVYSCFFTPCDRSAWWTVQMTRNPHEPALLLRRLPPQAPSESPRCSFPRLHKKAPVVAAPTFLTRFGEKCQDGIRLRHKDLHSHASHFLSL